MEYKFKPGQCVILSNPKTSAFTNWPGVRDAKDGDILVIKREFITRRSAYIATNTRLPNSTSWWYPEEWLVDAKSVPIYFKIETEQQLSVYNSITKNSDDGVQCLGNYFRIGEAGGYPGYAGNMILDYESGFKKVSWEDFINIYVASLHSIILQFRQKLEI